MRLFRLYDSKFAADPVSGRGAFLFGGRWNEKGTFALYTATTPELAVLESVFRLTPDNLPAYHLLILDIADGLIDQLDTTMLPASWRDRQYSGRPVQRLLTDWFLTQPSMGMAVPSALMPLSLNVVLNPLYPQFSNMVTVIENAPYRFD